MRQKLSKKTVIKPFFVGFITLLVIGGCSSHLSGRSDFNLIFKFGVGAQNELNTLDQTFTKDMIVDSNITVTLSLSKEELDTIYQKMIEIDFFSYPDTFAIYVAPGETRGIQSTYSSYYFKVEYDSKIKELWWEDEIVEPIDDKAEKLRELITLIRGLIYSKEAYKKLPRPRGGYI